MRSRRSRRTAAPNHKPRRRLHNRIRAAAARHRHHEAETLHRSNERLDNHSTNRRHIAVPARGPTAAAQTGNTDHPIKRLGSHSTNRRHIAVPARGPTTAAQTGNTDHPIKRVGSHSSNRRHMANTSNESGSCYTKPSRLPARRSNEAKPPGKRSGFIAVRYGTPAATRTERSNIMTW